MIVRQNDAKREAEQKTSEDAREHDAADRQGPSLPRAGHGLLVRVRRIALEAVHHARLGGAEGDPVPRGVLQLEKEGFASCQGPLVQIFPSLELDLKGELADQR